MDMVTEGVVMDISILISTVLRTMVMEGAKKVDVADTGNPPPIDIGVKCKKIKVLLKT